MSLALGVSDLCMWFISNAHFGVMNLYLVWVRFVLRSRLYMLPYPPFCQLALNVAWSTANCWM